jgi:cytochrome c-type biogenesis protein CcmE
MQDPKPVKSNTILNNKLNQGQIGALLLMAISVLFIMFQLLTGKQIVYFKTPTEVYSQLQSLQDATEFRMSGLVENNSVTYVGPESVNFKITDLKGHDFVVHYTGVIPDLFKENQGVVLQGTIRGFDKTKSNQTSMGLPIFVGNQMFVKHSEVYDTKADHANLKSMKIVESIDH